MAEDHFEDTVKSNIFPVDLPRAPLAAIGRLPGGGQAGLHQECLSGDHMEALGSGCRKGRATAIGDHGVDADAEVSQGNGSAGVGHGHHAVGGLLGAPFEGGIEAARRANIDSSFKETTLYSALFAYFSLV